MSPIADERRDLQIRYREADYALDRYPARRDVELVRRKGRNGRVIVAMKLYMVTTKGEVWLPSWTNILKSNIWFLIDSR